MELKLRDYQEDCLKLIQEHVFKRFNRQMVVLPTGSGKTIIFSHLIRQKNLKTLVIAHRIELLEQAKDKLKMVAPEISSGIFCGDQKCHDKQVTIASIQSANRNLDLLKAENYQLLIIDEAHHAAAPTYRKLVEHLGFKSFSEDEASLKIDRRVAKHRKFLGIPHRSTPKEIKKAYRKHLYKHRLRPKSKEKIMEAYEVLTKKENQYSHTSKEDLSKLLIGFTATPKRGDKIKLCDLFQDIVFNLSIKKLVNAGYLVKPEGVHVKVGIDLRKVKKERGDFQQGSLREVMNSIGARKIVVDAIKKFAPNRKGIVFSVDINHSEKLKEDIETAGFSCGVVHSNIPMQERQNTIQSFASGDLQFITNPMILTEGFDCPRADCMINAAPTQNRSLYTQKAGRVLRIHPDKKDALLIDFGDTKRKHKLKTVVDLFGQEAVLKTVTEAVELEIEQPDIMGPKFEIKEAHHDPLSYIDKEEEALEEEQLQQDITEDPEPDDPYWEEQHLFSPVNFPLERKPATKKQMDYMKKLIDETKTVTQAFYELDQMGIGHAKKAIEYLVKKRDRVCKSPHLTDKQEWFLRQRLGEGVLAGHSNESIGLLSIKEAGSLISKCKSYRAA